MALPVTNNNNAQPITTGGAYCQIQVPGYLPPQIAGQSPGSVAQFGSFSYQIVSGSTGAGTVVTFQSQGSDGVFRPMSNPAPITVANSTTYQTTVNGNTGALQLLVSGVTGNGLSYASLTASPSLPITSGTSGASGPTNQAQISVYDDFTNSNMWIGTQPVGNYPGNWVSTNGTIGVVTPTGAANGVISIVPGNSLNANSLKSASAWPVPYSNITKIVARFVFAVTNAAYPAGQEATLGFTHNGSQGADGSNNLYGAFINYCPNYTNLPDWDTRAIITPAGFTYGVYGGTAVSFAGFGYKNSQLFSSITANTWYEGIISMIPGVSCAFYMGAYGSPALDRICTVTALIANVATAGPVVCMNMSATAPGLLNVDKAQYSIWTSEGNKALSDSALYAL